MAARKKARFQIREIDVIARSVLGFPLAAGAVTIEESDDESEEYEETNESDK